MPNFHKHHFMILRYFILVLSALFSKIFYTVFFLPTFYSVYFLLKLVYSVSLLNATIAFKTKEIELIDACIAGSAYFLLFILNLSTPMKSRKRIKVFVFDFGLFFLFNIIRISTLSALYFSDFVLFETFHLFFWYFGSVFFVFLIWLFTIKLFDIKEIPFFSDLSYLWSFSKKGLKRKGKKTKKIWKIQKKKTKKID